MSTVEEFERRVKKINFVEIKTAQFEKQISQLKVSLIKDIQKKFTNSEIEEWDQMQDKDKFNEELNLILRAAVKTTKIVRISRFWENAKSGYRYVTREKGLKVPYSWSGTDILYDLKDISISLKGDLTEGKEEIFFSELSEARGMDQEKVKLFLEYLRKVFILLKSQAREVKKLDALFGQDSAYRGLSEMSEYSDTEHLERVVKGLPKLKSQFPLWHKARSVYAKKRNVLLKELAKINKPFRILMKLSESSESSV